MQESISAIVDRISALPRKTNRTLVAIAGGPASGKSILAQAVVEKLNETQTRAALVPMDGYHLDNATLDQMQMRTRKGAPDTFDAQGFIAMIAELRDPVAMSLPGFDRAMDKTVPGAISVQADHRIAVIEGNYLCLSKPPWDQLAPLWDLSVFLAPERSTARARLMQRWLEHGYSQDAAATKTEENDLVNFDLVATNRMPVDLLL